MTTWYPNIQLDSGSYSFGLRTLLDTDLEKIRAIIREEIQKALPPESEAPSAEVEVVQDGKRWKGTVYFVEDGESESGV